MKLRVTRQILESISKRHGLAVTQSEVDERRKTIFINAVAGQHVEFTTGDLEVRIKTLSTDVEIIEPGSVALDYAKLDQIVARAGENVEIEVVGAECRIMSPPAVWRLRVNEVSPIAWPTADWTNAKSVRTELLKEGLSTVRAVIPTDCAESVVKGVRMAHVDSNGVLATDSVRILLSGVEIQIGTLDLSRRTTDAMLKLFSFTGAFDMTVVELPTVYMVRMANSEIVFRKLTETFPLSEITKLMAEPREPWIEVRRLDLIDALKKASVTCAYDEPKIRIISSETGIELRGEDEVGNASSVSLSGRILAQLEIVVRADLLSGILEPVTEERATLGVVKDSRGPKFIHFVEDRAHGITGVVMVIPPVFGQSGKKSATQDKKDRDRLKKESQAMAKNLPHPNAPALANA